MQPTRPTQTELHRHLDVSMRLETLLELARAKGLESGGTSLESFRSKIVLSRPLPDLNAVLATFQLFQKVFDRPGICERVAFEAIEDCRAEGTRRIEYRFSPSFVCAESGMKWQDALDGFERGLKRATAKYPEMQAGLVCIASRDFGLEAVEETVEFFLKNRSVFCALDLAGEEADFPCRLYEKPFKKARQAGARITVHAGEASGPENIWEAIDLLGATRIGHGISAIRDAALMRTLAEKKICLEMCPTSNWLTRAVPSFGEHPLPRVLRAGVPVCINTDDPAVFGTTLPIEMKIAREQMGLSEAEISQCTEHAFRSSFIQ